MKGKGGKEQENKEKRKPKEGKRNRKGRIKEIMLKISTAKQEMHIVSDSKNS